MVERGQESTVSGHVPGDPHPPRPRKLQPDSRGVPFDAEQDMGPFAGAGRRVTGVQTPRRMYVCA